MMAANVAVRIRSVSVRELLRHKDKSREAVQEWMAPPVCIVRRRGSEPSDRTTVATPKISKNGTDVAAGLENPAVRGDWWNMPPALQVLDHIKK